MSAESDFERIKMVPDRVKSLLFGYFRESEKELELAANIAELIIFHRILYYHEFEYFTKHGSNIKLSNNGTIATVIDPYDTNANTVYGNISIKKSIDAKLIWSIKIIKLGSGIFDADCEDIYVGIDSSDKANTKWTNQRYDEYQKEYQEYGYHFEDGNVVKMEINTDEEYLKYYINDEDLGIAFEDIFPAPLGYERTSDEYHLAVALQTSGTAIQIIDFEMKPLK